VERDINPIYIYIFLQEIFSGDMLLRTDEDFPLI